MTEPELITEPEELAEISNAEIITAPIRLSQPAWDMSGAKDDAHLIDMFINSRASKNTRAVYRPNIDRFMEWLAKPLRQVTLADLTDYLELVKQSKLKPSGILSRINPVKSLLSYGQKLGYLQFNVGSVITLPQPERIIEDKVLSELALRKILKTLEDGNKTQWLVTYTMYSVGARVTEFLSLRHRDFKSEEGNHYFIFRSSTTKSGKTRRVRIPDFLAEEIAAHIAWKDREDMNEPIFSHQKLNGEIVGFSRQWVNHFLKRVCDENKLPKCTPHMLRHSVATHAIKRGMPIHVVSHMLGHSGVDITARTYDHNEKSDCFQSGLL